MEKANQYQYQNDQPMIEEFSDSIITYSDMAEIILENSLFTSKKKALMKEIDLALIDRNNELFIQLSTQYNTLLTKFQYLKDYDLGDS
jgi:uncharacterized protein YpiB (UPF0302 family)